MVFSEPILDFSLFSHCENGSILLGNFPEVNVACPQSDPSEDVGLKADCIILLIFVEDPEDS